MSAKVMGHIWDLSLPHAEMLVLLAMADHADHEGKNIFPSVDLIAWKTGYSERQVQRVIRSLVDKKILVVVKAATPRTTTQYKIDMDAGEKKPARKEGCQNVTPNAQGCQNVTPEATGCHPWGDIAMSPEPSVNQPVNRHGGGGIPTAQPASPDAPQQPTGTTAAAELPQATRDAIAIWCETFPNEDGFPAQEVHRLARISDLAAWRRACEQWRAEKLAGKPRNARSIGALMDRYDVAASGPAPAAINLASLKARVDELEAAYHTAREARDPDAPSLQRRWTKAREQYYEARSAAQTGMGVAA